MTDRSLILFEESISSKASLGTYRFGLNRFTKYYKLKSGDALLKFDPKDLQTKIEDYVLSLRKEVSANSVSTYMKGVEHFFVMNDFILNWKKIHKLFPETVKKAGGNAYTTQDIQNMVRVTKNLKILALIHILASTGVRIGALPELKLKHVKDLTGNCKAILFYPDSKFEYYGFLTPESSKALDNYLEQRKREGEYLTNESPLFRIKYLVGSLKAKHCTVGSLKNLVRKTVDQSVTRERVGRRFNKAMDHAFRKRFNTILKNNKDANRSLTEKLMSHETKDIPLDGTYHDPDIDALFTEFKKHIYNLTVNDDERLLLENKQQKEKLDELEQEKRTTASLKEQMSKMQGHIERLQAMQTPISEEQKVIYRQLINEVLEERKNEKQ